MSVVRQVKIMSLFWCSIGFSQPMNDECSNAIQLCPDEIINGNTAGATTVPSDNDICYTPENTIWYKFTTNDVGGGVTVSFDNLIFNPDPTFGQSLQANFFEASGPCLGPYTPMSDCGDSGIDFSISELIVLAPNTTYYIQVSGTSDGAINPSECEFDISISGTGVEKTAPNATINVANSSICQGQEEPLNLNILNCDEPTNYEWIYNGTTVFSENENTFSTAELDENGTLELVITCGLVCPLTDTSNSLDLIITPVSAEAGEDQVIDQGEQVSLDGSGIGSPTWTPGTTLTTTTTLSPIANPTITTTYFLTMENEGCFATDSVTIYVGDIITIYSAFTPNGDNINDKWHIVNSERFPNMEVYIYDRSGQLVFNAVNYTSEDQWWDGTFKGKDLPTSVYYYVIRLNDTEKTEYKGYVNLLR